MSLVWRACLGSWILVTVVGRCAVAESPEPTRGSPPSLHDPRDLEAFVASVMRDRMTAHHVPGGIFVLVKDGRVLLARGYGYADLEQKIPMDPDRTLLPVATVSMLFTATAVMQQVEQGRLALEADVNTYLNQFQIGRTYPRPVTVGDLLTHTAGFDEQYVATVVRTRSELLPLGAHLRAHMPPRVRPPGVLSVHGGWGIALAGHLVEEVSGLPFPRYMEDRILKPLGMSQSTFEPPIDRLRDLAVGYVFTQAGHRPARQYMYTPLSPSAGLTTTAADMARFMIAHLEGGRYGDARILESATVQEMHRRHLSYHPRLAGMAYGFYERLDNGLRTLLHDGDWTGHSSRVLLVPEERLGLFVFFNSWLLQCRAEVVGRFLDRHYPAPETAEAAASPAPGDVERFRGRYRITRSPRTTFLRLLSLNLESEVLPGRNATVRVRLPRSPEVRFVREEPLVFRQQGGKGWLLFREDEKGGVTHAVVETRELSGFLVLEKLQWFETMPFHRRALAALGLLSLSMVAWPLGWVVRRLRRRPGATTKAGRWARLSAALSLAMLWAFLLGLSAGVAAVGTELPYGVPPVVRAVLCLPWVALGSILALLYYAVRAWREGFWSVPHRLHYSLLALAAAACVPFLFYWRLLAWPF